LHLEGAHLLGNNNQFHGVSSNSKVSGLPWREQATVRTAEQQEYFCRADADAAAAQLRAVHTPYHLVDVTVEERPVYGRGRPSAHKPRLVKALR
jgi:hypothetical protein